MNEDKFKAKRRERAREKEDMSYNRGIAGVGL